MLETWVYFTILAAFMQAVRTAGQKQLSQYLTAVSTTLVRFLFALPFVWIYLYLMILFNQSTLPVINNSFIQSAVLASIAQIIGTGFVIKAFDYQNFAVATSLVKTEAVLTAVIGVIVFDAVLSGLGWLSVIFGVLGVLILSKVDLDFRALFKSPASAYGLGAGLAFAFATLWIRQASLSLNTNLMISAAYTLAFMVTLQSVLIVAFVLMKDKIQLVLIKKHWRASVFVGISSMLGSVGWFTAASFQNAAYVKALGQIEFFFTLFITHKIFREHISPREYLGMSLIVISVLTLLLLA